MTKANPVYKRAGENDCSVLTEIANVSKKHWEYSDELMNLWKEDLEINKKYIAENEVTKVLSEKRIIAFYALKFDRLNECYEIDHFWILPEFAGQGFGKEIFQNIMQTLANKHQTRTFLEADPNAAGFYKKMDGKLIGQKESKISGRYLPIFEFTVK
jgi:RimJ/RimL family protein N-acetyltransferase